MGAEGDLTLALNQAIVGANFEAEATGDETMDRRTFLVRNMPAATLGLSAWRPAFAAISSGEKTMSSSYFEFMHIHMQSGSQPQRMSKWLESRLMPMCQKHGFGPMGFFNVDIGPSLPTAVVIFSYPSLAAMEALWGKLNSDPDYATAVMEVEAEEPAFYRSETALLRSTTFCPPLVATPASDPSHKLYELRIYESPTNRQLNLLHDRFSGGEINVFHKNGIRPILYANTVFGTNMPNMAYLIPFASADHRDKAWTAFRNDPDWIKLRDDSIRRGGEIVRNITSIFLSPMRFSMLR